MMRSPHGYCVAVRKPNGELVTEAHALPRLSDRWPIFKLPVLRGLGTLGQAMWLGMKALRFSATHAIQDETTTENGNKDTKDVSSWAMGLNVLISVAFFLVMYKFVPLYLATLLGKTFPAVGGRFAINMVDGTIRIIIFLGFLYLMSRMKEIHRVFEYHGAEHRVVFNFESGQAVTVANAQRFDTWHPRCGTSFLVVVMVLSMAVYALLPFDGFLAKLVGRIALLPVVVGVSYELIRFAAKRQSSLLAMLTRPGLWLQRVTTQPPSNDQTEVAILALDQAMELEKEHGGVLVIA